MNEDSQIEEEIPSQLEQAQPETLSDNAGSTPDAETESKPPIHAGSTPKAPTEADRNDAEQKMRLMSRRSFLWSALAVGGTFTGWRWLTNQRSDNGTPWPLRRALETNGELARDYFKSSRLAPTFPASAINRERVNGDIGLGEDFEVSKWKLRVDGLASGETVELSLADIKALPRTEMITELKCIEGWAIIISWAGVRFADFLKKYPPVTDSGNKADYENNLEDLPQYVGMATPGREYYVGLDFASALHPQTLLVYEMYGKPLTLEHGAPLRLAIPVKYGIKNIKRIGHINFSNKRPDDYWAEQGYDWYAGH